MNLEGTKHEKAVLVIVAYIIGFTSGFIAFGVANLSSNNQVAEIPPVTTGWPEGYMPPTEMPPMETMEMEAMPLPDEAAYYQDGKLYATVGAERFVLSLHSEIMPTENVEGFSTQGIHENLPKYAASADGRYVYFCEQQTTDPECTSFIFDVAKSVIQPVSIDGERLITPNEVAEDARWEGDRIVIGSYTSDAMDTPWKVALAQ